MNRTILPMLAGVILASAGGGGCIPVPGNYRPVDGSLRPEQKIGKGSGKPLRVSESDRERVIAVLGPPAWITPDGMSMVFNYEVVPARQIWVYPFGIASVPHTSIRYLRVRFDALGKLAGYSVFREYRSLTADVGSGGLLSYGAYRKSLAAASEQMPLPPLGADTREKD